MYCPLCGSYGIVYIVQNGYEPRGTLKKRPDNTGCIHASHPFVFMGNACMCSLEQAQTAFAIRNAKLSISH